jgi:hypothetical protein
MSDDQWTVGRLLSWTAGWLAERGSESPRIDAEVLLAHVRGCQRILLYTAFDEVVAEVPTGLAEKVWDANWNWEAFCGAGDEGRRVVETVFRRLSTCSYFSDMAKLGSMQLEKMKRIGE